MTIHEFDVVRLKDGREGVVADIWADPTGKVETGYYIEICGADLDLDSSHPTVTIDQIDKVVERCQ